MYKFLIQVYTCLMNTSTDKTKWPNLSVDQRAWEMAKTLVNENDLHALIAKAEEIKKSLKGVK